MKNVFVKSLASGVLLVGATYAAFGAQSAVIAVTGKLIPGTCDVTLANGGDFAFPDTPLASLRPDVGNTLPKIETTMTILCSNATTVGFQLKDNAEDSVDTTGIGGGFTASYAYGLGYASDGTTKLGAYFVRLLSMKVDGNDLPIADIAVSSDDGNTWNPGSTSCSGTHCTLRNGSIYSPANNNQPRPYTTFSASFDVYPGLKGTSFYPQGQVQHLNGNATLQLFEI